MATRQGGHECRRFHGSGLELRLGVLAVVAMAAMMGGMGWMIHSGAPLLLGDANGIPARDHLADGAALLLGRHVFNRFA